MSECKKCGDTTSSGCTKGCIGVPMNASAWNIPNFTGCELNSLPPGICPSEWDCIKKVPACSVEGGHALKLIKLSNYIDLDKLAKFNPALVQTKFKNEDVLSAITCAPVLGLKSGINTIATQHCDGKWQIDLVSNIALTETKKVQYCGVNGSSFFVASGEVNPDSIQVFINGILQTGTTPVYNGANTNIQLQSSVSNVCVDIFYEAKLPEVVTPDAYETKVSDDDVAGYLENKVQGSNGITSTVQNFGGSEYIDFSLTNPTPTPGAGDVNKIIYVDEDGNYSLGSPCCDAQSLTITGTDGEELTATKNTLDFASEGLDITVADADADDGKVEVTVDLKDDLELFNISNLAGSSVHPITLGDDLVFKSDDNSVLITVTDGVINFQGLSQTLSPHHHYVDMTGADAPTSPTAPTTPNPLPVEGDTLEEVYDDFLLKWSYNGTTWSLISTTPVGGGVAVLDDVDYGGKTTFFGTQTFAANVTADITFSNIVNANNALAGAPSNGVQSIKGGLHYIGGQVFVKFDTYGQNSYVLNLKKDGNVMQTIENEGTFGDQTIQFFRAENMDPNEVITIDLTLSSGGTIDLTPNRHYIHISPLR